MVRFLGYAGLVALLASIVVAVGLAPQSVLAIDAEVEGETCTREDLADAVNIAGDGSTITFDCDNPIIHFAEDEQIAIVAGQTVTIDGRNGNGEQIILQGGGDDYATRIFRVEASGTLTLKYLTMEDGNAPGTYIGGGAIRNQGGTLNVIASTFRNNQSSIHGGAIHNLVGSVTISQSVFINNRSESGGAISQTNAGTTLEINDSRFEGNSATLRGGALNTLHGSTTIRRSTFADNEALLGGAIMAHGGQSIDVIGSTFLDNKAQASGSAIFVGLSMGPTSLRWSTIIQPEDTVPALYLEADVTAEGVILGGEGIHCEFNLADLTDSYTLSNDTSCGLDGTESVNNVLDLGVGSRSVVTINGVEQNFFPLVYGSPAIDIAPASACDTDLFEGQDTDQIGAPRPGNGRCDAGAIETYHATSVEGTPVDITITPGPQDSTSPLYAIDCDISQGPAPTFDDSNSVTCIAPDDASFVGLARLSDGDVTTSARSLAIRFNNLDPTMESLDVTPTLIPVNEAVTIQALATDVPADQLEFTIKCGPSDSTTTRLIDSSNGEFRASESCTFTQAGNYTISVTATDDDGGESQPMTSSVLVVVPASLCANRWNGSLSMADGSDCGRSETMIVLPEDAPLSLCVNNWNGATRASNDCGRGEHPATATGNGSIDICVNRWNDTIRASDRCSRSERPDML